MIGAADADAMAARLWQRWIAFFIHEVRLPIAVMGGHVRVLKAEADPEKRARCLEAAQSAHGRLVDYLTAVQQCSRGQATTVARLVESLHRLFTRYVNLTVTGDGEASVPYDCLGIALWLLMARQWATPTSDKPSVRLEVHATDAGGRIALAPEDSTGEWCRIDGTDVRGWWLEDVVNYLTVAGSVVEAFCRGNEFSLVITWGRIG